ncbi:MAG TPA: hypothetical protein VFF59_02455, partial [Anaerolineae bacterium]|nr:hypothetical protein [Anaerolineae bacterium]
GQNGFINGLGQKVIWGQLGIGTQEVTRSLPTDVVGLTSGVSRIFASDNTTCALAGGTVKCWGLMITDESGGGQAFNSPQSIQGLPAGVTGAAVGYDQQCAIVSGTIKCRGGNSLGQLGNGEAGSVLTPTFEVAPPITVTLSLRYLPLVRR